MKQIILKFTIAKGWASNLLYWVFRHPYTHIAISLDDKKFYSFTNEGFTYERKRKYVPKKWNDIYAYYYIDVNYDTYNKLETMISKYELKKDLFKYSYFTIIGAFFKIPIHQKNKYTCSQFVANLLKKSGAYPLTRKTALYLPFHILQEIHSFSRKEEHLCM